VTVLILSKKLWSAERKFQKVWDTFETLIHERKIL